MKTRSTSRGQGRQGDRAPEGRLCENHEPMNKNPIEGRSGAVSWHTTAKPFVSAREVNGEVVWWRTAFLPGEACRERSGQESAEAIVVGDTSRSAELHVKIAGSLTQRRAELHRSVLTARRTVNPPMTPDGEVEPRAVAMGSMWALRGGLRPVPHAGLSRVSAEPPCTDPYARWCGTRGWLS